MIDDYDDSIYFRFQAAVEGMAVSSATLQERLANAYAHVMMIEPERLPERAQLLFRVFGERLTRVKDTTGVIGHILATARTLSTSEAEELAFELVHIHDFIVADYHDHLGR